MKSVRLSLLNLLPKNPVYIFPMSSCQVATKGLNKSFIFVGRQKKINKQRSMMEGANKGGQSINDVDNGAWRNDHERDEQDQKPELKSIIL